MQSAEEPIVTARVLRVREYTHVIESLTQVVQDIPPGALAVVMVAAFAGGLIRGFVGFGGALVIILVASVTLGPTTAVPIAALSGLAATLQLLPSAVRHSEPAFALPFGIAAFLSAPVGTLVLVVVDADFMKIAISSFVLVMVAPMLVGWQPRYQFGMRSLIAAGVGTGLVQGAAGVGGPPAVMIALARPGSPERQRANVIGAVTALALCAMAPMWWHGLFTLEVVVLSLSIVPIYSFATWLGATLFRLGHQHYFRRASALTLVVTGIGTLAIAIRDLSTG